MIVYQVELEGKDSSISSVELSAGEKPFDFEYINKNTAFITLEEHLKEELRSLVRKIREVRQKKDIL